MRRVLVDPIPHEFSPPMGQQAHIDPPVPEHDMDVEIASTVPDAQSAPNAVVGDACQTHIVVADSPHEIPLTQNHSSVLTAWLFATYPFVTSISFIISLFLYLCCRRHS